MENYLINLMIRHHQKNKPNLAKGISKRYGFEP